VACELGNIRARAAAISPRHASPCQAFMRPAPPSPFPLPEEDVLASERRTPSTFSQFRYQVSFLQDVTTVGLSRVLIGLLLTALLQALRTPL
jgi:hypothetical protein